MQYEIKGGSFPVVECKLEDGRKNDYREWFHGYGGLRYGDVNLRRRCWKDVFQSIFR